MYEPENEAWIQLEVNVTLTCTRTNVSEVKCFGKRQRKLSLWELERSVAPSAVQTSTPNVYKPERVI